MIGRKARQRENLKKLAIGSTIAAAAGYVAGVLTAPKSGKQTRGDIKNAANKGIEVADKDLKKLHAELDKVVKDAKTAQGKASVKVKAEINKAIISANKSKDKAREVLSAVRKGSADNEELDKAVKESKAAIKHLKNFIKKK